jgi:hypothetical protein
MRKTNAGIEKNGKTADNPAGNSGIYCDVPKGLCAILAILNIVCNLIV